ncbi:MAG: serine/threonine-protein kinase [Halioglobus sp.]
MTARIGPYRVLRLINEGGQGRVYLGYDNRLQRRVAIKLYRLPPDHAQHQKLLNEAQLIASLKSSKVVQIHDVIVGEENIALVMEYVSGCDLQEVLNESTVSPASALSAAIDIAGALAAARSEGIVHRDLKPRNVLVTSSGRVKLTDFGIASSAAFPGQDGRTEASASCISPEQYLGGDVDIRSDFFALGCLMYRMLTRTQPFISGGMLDPDKLLNHSPPALDTLLPDLPVGLSQLVSNLLQKDPDHRPADTQQLRYALRDISRGIPLSVSSSLLEESRPFFRAESASDLPLVMPADLQRGARSHFSVDGRFALSRLVPRSHLARATVLLGVAAAISLVLKVLLIPSQTRIHIDQPQVSFSSEVITPAEVSQGWVVEQVKIAVGDELGELFVSGPVGATPVRTLFAASQESEPDEQLTVLLKCPGQWCLFSVSRGADDLLETRQAVLLSNMSTEHWRQTIQSVTRDLYH